MKKLTLTALALSTLFLSACQHNLQTKDQATDQLMQQTVFAVNWVQDSGEYAALAYQAFNTAKTQFDQAKVAKGKKKAVVVDLDETMIDNSAHAAWQIEQSKNFNPEVWTKWVEARQATAIPGAVEFNNYVNSHNGTVFYVSNRKDSNEKVATIDNLKALGFTGVSEKTLLLKQDKSNKLPRFQQVEALGYDIVMYIGDNLNDFSDEPYRKPNAERKQFVERYQTEFGKKFIVLPNPTYGDWEGGLGKDYFKQDSQGKLKIRAEALNSWNGQ